jgi:O-antigen/teichoic acid export membrane protein
MAADTRAQKVIVRGAGTNALSFVLRFAARAGFLWIGAHLYGAATYGAFSLAVAVVELAVPIASLGLKRMIFPWLEQETGSRNPAHVLLDALAIGILGTALVAVIILAASFALPTGVVSGGTRFALAALAPALAGQVIADIALAATRWKHVMRYEVAGRGAIEPYVGTAVAALAWGVGWHAHGLLVGYAAGSFVLAIYALWSARRTFEGFALASWRPHPGRLLARSTGLLTASGSDALTALAQRADLYLVGLTLGDAAAGVYSVIRQLRTPILQVRQAFDGILTPIIARTLSHAGHVETGAATAAATRMILTAQLAVVLLMVAAGEPLLALFGARYTGGYVALIALSLAETLNGAFGVGEMIIYYLRPARALAINSAMIAVTVIVIPPLASRLGINAAALAVLIAALVAVWLRWSWLADFGIRHHSLHAAPPIVAAVIATIVGWGLHAGLNGLPTAATASLPALAALASYALIIGIWVRRRPDALSLARFRVG